MMKSYKLFSPFYDKNAWVNYSLRIPLTVDLEARAHTLVVGNTGSGKTYFLKSFLAHAIKANPNIELYVCDFKGDDFTFLQEQERYFVYDNYALGIEKVYERFKKRIEHKEPLSTRIILLMDEWNTYITSILEKKEQDRVKHRVMSILNMGRSKNISIVLGVQRADVKFIPSRDAFTNVVGLGALSKESISMIFSNDKENIEPQPRGHGYFLADGEPIYPIIVPIIRNMNNVEMLITKGVCNRG